MTAILAALLKRYWKQLAAGLAFAVVVTALLITRSTLESRTAKLETAERWQRDITATTSSVAGIVDKNGKPALLAVGQVGLQILYLGTKRDQLPDAVARKDAETITRGLAYANVKTTDAADVRTADARQAADRTRAETLTAIARAIPVSPDCRAPSAFLENLKGL